MAGMGARDSTCPDCLVKITSHQPQAGAGSPATPPPILGGSSAAWRKQEGARFCSSGEEPPSEHRAAGVAGEEVMEAGETPGNGET